MWKLVPWRRVLIIVVLLIAALLATGQAITFAWLSAFPERASQLGSLQVKFWSYTAAAVILILIDLMLAVRLVREMNELRRENKLRE
jgi:membrane protein implicated in regulation of membrane protease activity